MMKTIKQMYLVRGGDDESYSSFKQRIHDQMILVAKDSHHAVSYIITEKAPPAVSIIPFKKQKIASITVKTGENVPVESLLKIRGFEGAYDVTEALPIRYKKTWNDHEKTPGVCLLTLFKRKKGIDYKTFLHRWHNSHTPMSLKYHPLWHYNRNVVDGKLHDDSNHWDGIVEEHFKSRAELFNPFKFFGNPAVILPRMINVYRDTNSFLDYKTIEPYFVSEYHIKS
jgi:hypothetical protein